MLGNTYNEFLNKYRLADAGATEETNLSTTGIRSQQIHDLDTSNQYFSTGCLLDELWCLSVDGSHLDSFDRPSLVNWVTGDIHNTAKRSWADRNHDGGTSINSISATDETLGT